MELRHAYFLILRYAKLSCVATSAIHRIVMRAIKNYREDRFLIIMNVVIPVNRLLTDTQRLGDTPPLVERNIQAHYESDWAVLARSEVFWETVKNMRNLFRPDRPWDGD
jgi:hypothetical protein